MWTKELGQCNSLESGANGEIEGAEGRRVESEFLDSKKVVEFRLQLLWEV